MIEVVVTAHPESVHKIVVLNDTFEGTSQDYHSYFVNCWECDTVKMTVDTARNFNAERIRYFGPTTYCEKLVKDTRKQISIPVEVF